MPNADGAARGDRRLRRRHRTASRSDTTSQNPHVARLVLSAFIGIAPEHKLRVIAPDVGGGFGSKIFIYPEEIVCLWAAKKVGRPVKWTADRTEAFLTDAHGRDHVTARRDGASTTTARSSACGSRPTPISAPICRPSRPRCRPISTRTLLSGQYDIPAIYCEVDAVYTNTAPVDAYRGAGRPEATFVVERLIEVGGARARASTRPSCAGRTSSRTFPHQTPVIMTYDAGDYRRLARQGAGDRRLCKGFGKRKRESAARRQAARHRLLLLHRGLRHRAVGGGRLARRRRRPVGIGRGAGQPDRHGRGADRLAQPRPGPRDHLRAARLRAARHSDRATSRSCTATPTRCSSAWAPTARAPARSACRRSSRRSTRSRPRRKKIAAHLLEAAEGDIEFKDGKFTVAGTDKSLGLRRGRAAGLHRAQVLRRSELEPGLKEGAFYDPDQLHLPGRLPHLRGRDRSRDRRDRDRALDRGRRFRQHHQSDDRRGPGAWRHRAGHRPGAAGRRASTTRTASS